jgi:hypothetical protein
MTMTQVADLAKPVRVINVTKILPLFAPTTETALVPAQVQTGRIRLIHPAASAPAQLVRSRPPLKTRLEKLQPKTWTLPRATGTVSPINGTSNIQTAGSESLKLPYGMPRMVNVATLKLMLKADPQELVLKRVGERWEPCEDSHRVDLEDDKVEFRIGAVQVFS